MNHILSREMITATPDTIRAMVEQHLSAYGEVRCQTYEKGSHTTRIYSAAGLGIKEIATICVGGLSFVWEPVSSKIKFPTLRLRVYNGFKILVMGNMSIKVEDDHTVREIGFLDAGEGEDHESLLYWFFTGQYAKGYVVMWKDDEKGVMVDDRRIVENPPEKTHPRWQVGDPRAYDEAVLEVVLPMGRTYLGNGCCI